MSSLAWCLGRVRAGVVLAGVCSVSAAQETVVRTRASSDDVSQQSLANVERLARKGLERLAPFFPGTPMRPITFVVHDDSNDVPKVLLDSLHPGVPAFARLRRDEIHLVMEKIEIDPPNDLRTTVDHELVHILLDQYAGDHSLSVPRWFHEGLAQDLSGGTYLGVQEEDLTFRVKMRSYFPFRELRESFPIEDPAELTLAYGQSFSFVAFLRREVGLEPLLAAARECSPTAPFHQVVARRLRNGLVVYEMEWRDYVLHQSGAGFRVILRNCFLLLIVVAVFPLLALAVARRRNREEAIKKRMADEESASAGGSETGPGEQVWIGPGLVTDRDAELGMDPSGEDPPIEDSDEWVEEYEELEEFDDGPEIGHDLFPDDVPDIGDPPDRGDHGTDEPWRDDEWSEDGWQGEGRDRGESDGSDPRREP